MIHQNICLKIIVGFSKIKSAINQLESNILALKQGGKIAEY